ncbi:hypothetical protein M896_090010 [Ordospora colligata OC4]|uniref:Uncharacterized protein n=1 Tax=Ordospora colligata OC4 TaxID=1354746 RepID=A0A0B2UI87_9MICR|nr:uncharacterized protein M896_090010 [Ordospora colligata OC4]KHN69078.1 hypothetical protein M896_090010 [Ordospora colligata OC4]
MQNTMQQTQKETKTSIKVGLFGIKLIRTSKTTQTSGCVHHEPTSHMLELTFNDSSIPQETSLYKPKTTINKQELQSKAGEDQFDGVTVNDSENIENILMEMEKEIEKNPKEIKKEIKKIEKEIKKEIKKNGINEYVKKLISEPNYKTKDVYESKLFLYINLIDIAKLKKILGKYFNLEDPLLTTEIKKELNSKYPGLNINEADDILRVTVNFIIMMYMRQKIGNKLQCLFKIDIEIDILISKMNPKKIVCLEIKDHNIIPTLVSIKELSSIIPLYSNILNEGLKNFCNNCDLITILFNQEIPSNIVNIMVELGNENVEILKKIIENIDGKYKQSGSTDAVDLKIDTDLSTFSAHVHCLPNENIMYTFLIYLVYNRNSLPWEYLIKNIENEIIQTNNKDSNDSQKSSDEKLPEESAQNENRDSLTNHLCFRFIFLVYILMIICISNDNKKNTVTADLLNVMV